jgi:hypothetical protein
MKKQLLTAVTAFALSSLVVTSGVLAQRVDIPANQPIVQFDPARLYGWVEVPNTNTAVTTNVRLPNSLLGPFNTFNAPAEARGPSGLGAGVNISPQLRIAAVRGPVGIGVELRRARLSTEALNDGSSGELLVQLRVFANSSELTSGEQFPVEIVLENPERNARMGFFITLAVR